LKKILAGFALQNNCAYWDPIPVFGGYGCMNRWYRQNLCVKDRIHLTKPGYALLGEMLVEALDKSFTAFAGKTAR
jgi:lysophospholipase L1-like esterase